MNLDTILPIVIVVAIMLLIGFPVHEFSHALAAYRLGDGTAKLFGRLTLNPVAHFDPLGGILLAATFIGSGGTFGFGWAKPTPVNPSNLEGGRRGEGGGNGRAQGCANTRSSQLSVLLRSDRRLPESIEP